MAPPLLISILDGGEPSILCPGRCAPFWKSPDTHWTGAGWTPETARWKVKLSLYRPWRPLWLREVKALTFSDIWLTDGGKVISPTRREPARTLWKKKKSLASVGNRTPVPRSFSPYPFAIPTDFYKNILKGWKLTSQQSFSSISQHVKDPGIWRDWHYQGLYELCVLGGKSAGAWSLSLIFI
jgi:hypothetical protein